MILIILTLRIYIFLIDSSIVKSTIHLSFAEMINPHIRHVLQKTIDFQKNSIK
jgi:hypothetical protein